MRLRFVQDAPFICIRDEAGGPVCCNPDDVCCGAPDGTVCCSSEEECCGNSNQCCASGNCCGDSGEAQCCNAGGVCDTETWSCTYPCGTCPNYDEQCCGSALNPHCCSSACVLCDDPSVPCESDWSAGSCVPTCPTPSNYAQLADGTIGCVCYPGITGASCDTPVPFPWLYHAVSAANNTCSELYVEANSTCFQTKFPSTLLDGVVWWNGTCPEPYTAKSNSTVYCGALGEVAAIITFTPA